MLGLCNSLLAGVCFHPSRTSHGSCSSLKVDCPQDRLAPSPPCFRGAQVCCMWGVTQSRVGHQSPQDWPWPSLCFGVRTHTGWCFLGGSPGFGALHRRRWLLFWERAQDGYPRTGVQNLFPCHLLPKPFWLPRLFGLHWSPVDRGCPSHTPLFLSVGLLVWKVTVSCSCFCCFVVQCTRGGYSCRKKQF